MEDNINSNEDQLESGEARNTENKELDDATSEPRAHVEQSGDYQQAEAIQDTLTHLTDGIEPADVPLQPVKPLGDAKDLPLPCPPGDLPDGSAKLGDNTYSPNPGIPKDGGGWLPETNENMQLQNAREVSNPATSNETIDPSQLEYEPGPVQQPPDWDHGPPKDKVNLEDENTVLGRQPKVREDLGDLKPAGSDDDDKEEATPINLPGPTVAEAPEPGPHPFPNVAIEDDGSGGRMIEVGLSPDDVKISEKGIGANISKPADPNEPPPPPDMSSQTALSPDDVKLEGGQSTYQTISDEPHSMKNEEEGLANQAKIRSDLDDISFEKGEDGKDEATPINLPGTQQVSDDPDRGPNPFTNEGSNSVAKDHPDTGGNVAQKPDPEPWPKGNDVTGLPIPLFNAPDFEAMNTSEQSVVEIIGKAITDKEYRTTLFADVKGAVAGYEMADEDQIALGEMTNEAFDFFATEVDTRFSEAKVDVPEAEHQSLLAQVVHAVWRDLNPGSLTYVLAYKIPQKYL